MGGDVGVRMMTMVMVVVVVTLTHARTMDTARPGFGLLNSFIQKLNRKDDASHGLLIPGHLPVQTKDVEEELHDVQVQVERCEDVVIRRQAARAFRA